MGSKWGKMENLIMLQFKKKQLLKMNTWKDEKFKTNDEWNEGWKIIIIIIIIDWQTSWNLGKILDENSNNW
jgi:hypothetical protein